jgi:hypothetical protein
MEAIPAAAVGAALRQMIGGLPLPEAGVSAPDPESV